jgi:hypothetical protein
MLYHMHVNCNTFNKTDITVFILGVLVVQGHAIVEW